MASLWGDIGNVAKTVGKDVLKGAEGIPIVGSGVALPAAGIEAATGDTKDAANSLRYAIPGLGSLEAYGSLGSDIQKQTGFNPSDITKWLGLPSGGQTPAKKPAATTPAAAAQQPGSGSNPTNDALTMGLGMFFKQYMAPLMQMQNQQNTSAIKQYGDTMNQALQNPLPDGVKQIMQANLPQQQQLMQMLNQASAGTAASAIPYANITQGLGQETSALQAMLEGFTKAATASELGLANPSALQNIASGVLGSNSVGGILAQALGGGGATGLPGLASPAVAQAAGQTGTTGQTGTAGTAATAASNAPPGAPANPQAGTQYNGFVYTGTQWVPNAVAAGTAGQAATNAGA